MREWLRDAHFRSLLKNSSYLAASRVAAAIAGLVTLAFAGRGLGVLMFGTLILITSYAKAASGISKFQSWQLIVRYGGQGMAAGDPEKFKTSTGFAFALDVISGIGGMLLAVLILPFINQWVGINDQYLWLAMLYCTLLPTMGAATPTGVLRALDRFDLISWQGTADPIAKSIMAGAAFLTKAPFEAYVVIWYVTDLGGDLFLWFLAWRELKRHNLLEGIRPTLRPTSLPGAWRFAININLTASITTVWGPIGRLVVGGLLGPAGAALFRVASSLADSAQKPADMLGKAFYPEIVRMDLSSKKPWRLMLRSTAVAGGIALAGVLILVVGGKSLLGLIFGKDFVGAYAPLMVLLAVPVLGVISFPLAPMLYALGRSDGPLKARLVGSIIFLVVIAPFALLFGVIGAALAYVIGNVAQLGLMILQVWQEYRRIRAPAPHAG